MQPTTDYVSLGTSPICEDCVCVGEDDYMKRSMVECKKFITLIRELRGEEPFGARLKIKSCSHDFGTYLDVICEFDINNEVAELYACNLENSIPEYWEDKK